jgi:hypothetical protein
MRIEILVDSEDPQIFPLNKSKISIGSHEGCEVQLQADGVSRKHLQIITEDDKYYVVDQGSTNGSYINEERLVPGRRAEFTSFFPVRLGDKVLVTLLSDAEADDLGYIEESMPKSEASIPGIKRPKVEEIDSTRNISVKDLQSARTEKLVQKRQETVRKRKTLFPPPKKAPVKDKLRMLMVQIFSVALIGAAAYYNFSMTPPEPDVVKEPIKKIAEVVKVEPVKPFFPQVEQTDLTPIARFPEMAKAITCTSDLENFFCQLYQEKNIKNFGVLQVGTMINSMIDGISYLDKAREMLPKPLAKQGQVLTQEQLEKFDNDVKYTAMVLFLNDLPELNLEVFKDLKVTFSLLITDITSEPRYIAAAVVPESFNAFKQRLQEPNHFINAQRNGAQSIYFLKDYFTFY